eukprot:TRINITY_DN34791_c0_g1_i1.p1 TRINITY_DN34791_c0_g1~~TRINITY_DN34791_c0_g1_i1.p1  ORF type:complete len:433 (-),score=62.21 TRINITY_DN34791_c0_g1_i1:77-1339(-)
MAPVPPERDSQLRERYRSYSGAMLETTPQATRGTSFLMVPGSSSSSIGLAGVAAPSSTSSVPATPGAGDRLLLRLVDVELTPVPLTAFFKISVCPAGSTTPTHNIMKRYTDLNNFQNAVMRELGRCEGFPSLPLERSREDEFASPAFCSELKDYLCRLAACSQAVGTYSFRNFFQMTDVYQRPRSASASPSPTSSSLPGGADDVICGGAGGGAGGYTLLASATMRLAGSSVSPSPCGSGNEPPVIPAGSSPTSEVQGSSYPNSPQRHTFGLTRQHQPSTQADLQPPQVSTAPPSTSAQLPPTRGGAPSLPAEAVAADMNSMDAKTQGSQWSSGASPWSSVDDCTDQSQSVTAVRASDASKHRRSGNRRRPKCVICMAAPQEIAIDPCGHLSMCFTCASAVKACPVCRGPIEKSLRIFVVS